MKKNKKKPLRLPVVTLGAEYLIMGHLMRRNILAYKAPPNQEGYDIICIHPDPKRTKKQVRVQVKSRYQTDSDRSFLLKEGSFRKFDYLVGVFQNIGYFFSKRGKPGGSTTPEFYTLPEGFVRAHHAKVRSKFNKLRTKKLNLERYKNEEGFELIARDLGIRYPRRAGE